MKSTLISPSLFSLILCLTLLAGFIPGAALAAPTLAAPPSSVEQTAAPSPDAPFSAAAAALLADVQKAAAGMGHTCAITRSGALKCWGDNASGQLGDGSTERRSTPVDVLGLGGAVQAVALGQTHTCALVDGGVKCWGNNIQGQLGVGDAALPASSTPRTVSGLDSGVLAISAREMTTCAVLEDGTAQCWGNNSSGQLGAAVTGPASYTPVTIQGLSGVQAVSAGMTHVCALLSDGAVQCWGDNQWGQLGAATTELRSLTPVTIAALADVQAVSAGMTHTCALLGDETVKCWGLSFDGQLGPGFMYGMARLPVPIYGLEDVQAISAGMTHTCALLKEGGLRCWGQNVYGQLGDGSDLSSPWLLTPLGLDGGVAAVSAGSGHTCAVRQDGSLQCWGDNSRSQLGAPLAGAAIPFPVEVPALAGPVDKLAAGGSHACALLQDSSVQCWGRNSFGQLGDGSQTGRAFPVTVGGLGGVTKLDAGSEHTCALLSDQTAQCWGGNQFGQLGDGSVASRSTPAAVTVLPSSSAVAGIAVGYYHTCAMLQGGSVQCWGDNGSGQLGDGSLTSGVTSLAAGRQHTCALMDDQTVKCWGSNGWNQLGNSGAGSTSVAPVPVVGLAGAQAISAGMDHTCALMDDQTVKCWGSDMERALGELEEIGPISSATPLAVAGLDDVQELSAGDSQTCARTGDGGVTCWGSNRDGRLGIGTMDLPTAWTPVVNLAGVTSPAVGGGFACALLDIGSVHCWGENRYGQLGGYSGKTPLDVEAGPGGTYNIAGSVTFEGAPLAGVVISAGSQSVTTGSDGSYTLAVPAGCYTVQAAKEGYSFTAVQIAVANPAQVSVPRLDPTETSYANFEAELTLYTLSGRITLDGAGLAGVAVSAGSQSATTDASGDYAIGGLTAGVYTVTASKAEYSFGPASQEVTLGPNKRGVNFTAAVVTYTVAGRITVNGAGLAGVTVNAGDRDAVTAANGAYSIAGLPAGDYTVIAAKFGYSFDPATRQVTLGPDATAMDFTAQANDTPGEPPTYTLSGRISTADGAGVPGVTLTATRPAAADATAAVPSAVTGADGRYTISGLRAGSYTVTASKSGYTFDPATRQVTLGPDAAAVDFAGQAGETSTYAISGRITVNGAGLAGVTVSAGGQSAVTDADGRYTIAGLPTGSYTLSLSKAGYSLTPSTQQITLPLAAGAPDGNMAVEVAEQQEPHLLILPFIGR